MGRTRGRGSVVEHHLAKVGVAGSNPVVRSRFRPGASASPVIRHVGALLGYAAIFCALLLPKLLPAVPGQILANSPADGSIFLWALAWWPHAAAHGHLMPYSYALFAPGGTNLAWTTSLPVPGLVLAPITSWFGVVASFNVLAILAPVTAGWAAYLLVHRVTKRWWPSFAAGLLFALSPLETSEIAIGHVNLTLTALIPLAVYLVVRRLEGSLRPGGFVLLASLTLAAEIGISTEVFLTTTMFGVIALVLLFLWDAPKRASIRRCAALIGLAYAGAGVLASPMLYAAFAMPRPAGLTSPGSEPFSGVESHIGLHAGILAGIGGAALFAILAYLVWTRRDRPLFRALAGTAMVALVLAPGVVVVGATALPSPWSLVRHLPFLHLVRPQRLTMFAWLIGAVAAGVWLAASPRSWRRWGALVLALGVFLPALWLGSWTSVVPPQPSLALFSAGENVAVVAGLGTRAIQLHDLAFPAVWQVWSGFRFRLADAYVGSFPPALPLAVRRFQYGLSLQAGQRATVLTWLRTSGVGAVLVMRPTPAAVGPVARLLGTDPVWGAGVAIVPVPSG